MWKMAKLWLLVKARHGNFIAFSARTKLTYLWFSSIILFDDNNLSCNEML